MNRLSRTVSVAGRLSAGADRPSAGADRPSAGADRPSAGTSRPGAPVDGPGTGANHSAAFIEDILAQPQAFRSLADEGPARWDRTLAALGDLGRFARVVFTGMGSSYLASLTAAGVLTAWGVPAAGELASTLLHHGCGRLEPDDLLVALSQSGESVEIVKLLDSFGERHGGGKGIGPAPRAVLGVTCHRASPLGRMASSVLEVDVSPDHGVAVKTFGASLLALLYLAARFAGARLGGETERVSAWAAGAGAAAGAVAQANENAEAWRALGRTLVRFPAAAVTARGLSLSAAMAGALLFNEVAKIPAWAEESGEFRHGIVEVADSRFLAAVIVSAGPSRDLDLALVSELAATGARVITVVARSSSAAAALTAAGATVLEAADLDEPFLPLVQVVPFQWLSLGWAEARGFEPGRFRNMPGVVRSEGRLSLEARPGR